MQLLNSTQVPNSLLEALYIKNSEFTEREKDMLLYICRRTIGWQKTVERLTLKRIKTDMGQEKSNVTPVLRSLEEKGAITKDKEGGHGWVVSLNPLRWGFATAPRGPQNDGYKLDNQENRVISPITKSYKSDNSEGGHTILLKETILKEGEIDNKEILLDKKPIDNNDIVLVITAFRSWLPNEFSGPKNAYGNKTTRQAVAAALETKSVGELVAMVDAYAKRRMETYAPGVGSITEFFKYKFAKIEQFLGRKPAQGLAQLNIPGYDTYKDKPKDPAKAALAAEIRKRRGW